MNKHERAVERWNLNREADRLIRHLTKHPHDEAARARLLDVWEGLGVAVVR